MRAWVGGGGGAYDEPGTEDADGSAERVGPLAPCVHCIHRHSGGLRRVRYRRRLQILLFSSPSTTTRYWSTSTHRRGTPLPTG